MPGIKKPPKSGLSVCVLCFVMASVLYTSLSVDSIDYDDATATLTPVPTTFPAPLGLEMLFACPDEIVIGDGPTWQGIIVGETSLSEFRATLLDPAVFDPEFDIRVVNETSVSQLLLYGGYLLCVQDDIIVTVWTGQSLPNLLDMVAVYGIPDAVTWAPTYNLRVAFWFEHGIAVEILTATTDRTASSWGSLSSTFYFPYQETENFELRWPYDATVPDMPSLVGIGDPVPTEQNPFDFDAMIATITAQPTRTPTPTFTPRTPAPTRTRTPTPAPSTPTAMP